MPKPLRVLVVEDSAADAELLLLELGRGGYEVASERVDTAEAMRTALEAREWDIVISDHKMPRFDSLAALALVREKRLDLPFVIVSGTIGEDMAVACMKAGAHDYIMKGNLARLVPAVERELREAEVRRERKRAEEALRHEQAYNKAILSSMADALFVVSEEGAIRACNDRALAMLGYKRDELLEHSVGRLFASGPGMPERELHLIRSAVLRGEIRDLDAILRKRDGEKIPVSLSCALLSWQGAKSPEIVLVARDITDRWRLQEEQRKQAEQLAEEVQRVHEYAETVLRMSDPRSKLIGRSAAYKRIVKFVRAASEVPSPVLILGESGTGKEVVARAIRLNSPRAEKPFVVVDCAALGGSLIESELFGHEKGAFTGAHEAKAGLVEIADGGTLFVDEVGEMPLELQAKLLRALERGEFRRVGSVEERKADIRVIAATNQDLAAEVKKGRFRGDLYYRLNVLTFTMPPLRERREDIPLLAQHFLEHSRVTMPGKKRLRQDTLERLSAYDWPGNTRELTNLVERAIILSGREELLTPAHFPPEVREAPAQTDAAAPPIRNLADSERESLRAALLAANWNKTRAAELLGITRVTLRNKMRKHDIEAPPKR